MPGRACVLVLATWPTQKPPPEGSASRVSEVPPNAPASDAPASVASVGEVSLDPGFRSQKPWTEEAKRTQARVA